MQFRVKDSKIVSVHWYHSCCFDMSCLPLALIFGESTQATEQWTAAENQSTCLVQVWHVRRLSFVWITTCGCSAFTRHVASSVAKAATSFFDAAASGHMWAKKVPAFEECLWLKTTEMFVSFQFYFCSIFFVSISLYFHFFLLRFLGFVFRESISHQSNQPTIRVCQKRRETNERSFVEIHKLLDVENRKNEKKK